jgi:GNAT superfamily N-acetyltransferase
VTPPDVVVRLARDDELEAAGDLVVEAYLTLPGRHSWEDGYLDLVRDARRRARRAEVLVATDADGVLLGSVTYVPGHRNPWADVEQPGEAGFRMLGVSPAARGRGVGEALVQACLDRAVATGRSALAISTIDSWAAARRLYERMGFVHVPARDIEPEPGLRLMVYVRPL